MPPGRAIFAVVVPRVELEPEEKRYASRDARFRGATRPRVTRASHRASAFARTSSRFAPRTPRSNPRRSVTRLFRSARARALFPTRHGSLFPALTPHSFPSLRASKHRALIASSLQNMPSRYRVVERACGAVAFLGEGVPSPGAGPAFAPQVVANERCVLALVSRDVRASDVADAFRDACDAHAEEPRLRALALKRHLCGMSEKGSAFSFVLLDARTARVFAATTALSSRRRRRPRRRRHAAGDLHALGRQGGHRLAAPLGAGRAEASRLENRLRRLRRLENARESSRRVPAERDAPNVGLLRAPLEASRSTSRLFGRAGDARARASFRPAELAGEHRAEPQPLAGRVLDALHGDGGERGRVPGCRHHAAAAPARRPLRVRGGSTCSRSSSAPSGEAPRAPGRARARRTSAPEGAREGARDGDAFSGRGARGSGSRRARAAGDGERRRELRRRVGRKRVGRESKRVRAREGARARGEEPAAVLGHGVAGGRGVELAQETAPRGARARRRGASPGRLGTRRRNRPRVGKGALRGGARRVPGDGDGGGSAAPSFRAALERSHSMEGSGSPTRGGLTRAFASSGLT